MGGGGDQQPCRDPTADVDLKGEEGGCSSRGACPAHHSSHVSLGGSLGTESVTAHNLIRRALGLNLSLSTPALTFAIFSWHSPVCSYPALQSLQGALVQ